VDTTPDGRRARGLAVLEQLFGGEPPSSEHNAELMRLCTEHLFGEVWSRSALGLRDRELITIAVIAALGRERQLKLHIQGALNAGLSPQEVRETFIHIAYYAGFPAGFSALAVAAEVLPGARA